MLLFVFGVAMFYLDYRMRNSGGDYYPMLTLTAPLLIAAGLVAVIEAPPMPIEKMGFFGWSCFITGGIVGVWNAIF